MMIVRVIKFQKVFGIFKKVQPRLHPAGQFIDRFSLQRVFLSPQCESKGYKNSWRGSQRYAEGWGTGWFCGRKFPVLRSKKAYKEEVSDPMRRWMVTCLRYNVSLHAVKQKGKDYINGQEMVGKPCGA